MHPWAHAATDFEIIIVINDSGKCCIWGFMFTIWFSINWCGNMHILWNKNSILLIIRQRAIFNCFSVFASFRVNHQKKYYKFANSTYLPWPKMRKLTVVANLAWSRDTTSSFMRLQLLFFIYLEYIELLSSGKMNTCSAQTSLYVDLLIDLTHSLIIV